MKRFTLGLMSMLLLTSCSLDGDEGSQASMDEVVADIERIDAVTKTVRLTKDNDVDEMLGRPDGYNHAAVFYDSRLACIETGWDCGAMLEVWDDHDEADFRAEDLKARQTGMEFLGTQHVFVDGRMVLRVTGSLTQKQADEYRAAFTQ